MIKYLDLQCINARHEPHLTEAVQRVVASGRYLHGPEVKAFETAFADRCGGGYCVGVANGLDALTLILLSLKEMHGWDDGDEVIVPAMTFFATGLAVVRAGLHPVFCDVDPTTYLLDIQDAKQKINLHTRVLLPVHLYGRMANMSELDEFARHYGLHIVEDAAQAHGASDSEGNHPGQMSIAAAFSFYPGKNLGAMGDGGAVVTRDENLAEIVRRFANYGAEEKYVHQCFGINSRLDEVQASVLNVKLPHLDAENALRRHQAALYAKHIRESALTLPYGGEVPDGSVYHIYPLLVPCPETMQKQLLEMGVETLRHYPLPLHHQPAFKNIWNGEIYPMSEYIAAHELSLPIGPHLTDDEIVRVAESVVHAYRETI